MGVAENAQAACQRRSIDDGVFAASSRGLGGSGSPQLVHGRALAGVQRAEPLDALEILPFLSLKIALLMLYKPCRNQNINMFPYVFDNKKYRLYF